MNLTIADTFSKPILRSAFNKEFGKVGFSVVKVLVTRFINAFAFTTKLSEEQIEILTIDTLEHCSYETLHDVILFFKMCRSGKFGVAKKSVDSNLIFGEWFPKYLDLKSDARERIKSDEKTKHNSYEVSMDDVAKSYKKIRAQKRRRDAQNYINDITKNMDKQMLEDTITQWSKNEQLKPYLDMLKRKRKTILK